MERIGGSLELRNHTTSKWVVLFHRATQLAIDSEAGEPEPVNAAGGRALAA